MVTAGAIQVLPIIHVIMQFFCIKMFFKVRNLRQTTHNMF